MIVSTSGRRRFGVAGLSALALVGLLAAVLALSGNRAARRAANQTAGPNQQRRVLFPRLSERRTPHHTTIIMPAPAKSEAAPAAKTPKTEAPKTGK